MPTPEQFELYSIIGRDHGTSVIWQVYAEDSAFAEMGAHEAMHFLAYLLTSLKAMRITGTCYCRRPIQAMLETKNPAARPGSSDGSAQ
jgi:hypothetical protein